MTFDRTQIQGDEESHRARQLSLARSRPPLEVPGYDAQKFLGAGAYGEVWVAMDRNTGRRVAIKFFHHRGGVDWSLLSREVEKLVFLSTDRYVVQLLDVGWEANPPYYVMEYLEHGSLEERIHRDGALPPGEAVALFREVAIGLVHAHGRGVLHCDLKPANVLLDQDAKPRLADFGQSRLSHEQDPALGTLFYMAPEQADRNAAPDARWDVYALGAVLYTLLTAAPPRRDSGAVEQMESAIDLDDRLARYRRLIEAAPPLAAQTIPGVDRELAEILERCLAPDPQQRYPNPQAVLDALDARDARRARRPLVWLGMIGPALLLFVMGLAAWQGTVTAVQQSNDALIDRALESNSFAAQAAAKAVGSELERLYLAVEILADDPQFQQLLLATLRDARLAELREKLSDPTLDAAQLAPLRAEFRKQPALDLLQAKLAALVGENGRPPQWAPRVSSWFIDDPHGLQLARWPASATIGVNFAWRTYFQGGTVERPVDWRPGPNDHIQQTSLSAAYPSQSTGNWSAAISTPVNLGGPDGEFLGIVALSVPLGHMVELLKTEDQLAVLVDWREGPNQGLILQHPLFDLQKQAGGGERFKEYRIAPEALPTGDRERKIRYEDPTGADEQGEVFDRRWLAEMTPVTVRGKETGLWILVQQSHRYAIGSTLSQLRTSLLWIGLTALVVVALVLTGLWAFVTRRPNKKFSGGPTARALG